MHIKNFGPFFIFFCFPQNQGRSDPCSRKFNWSGLNTEWIIPVTIEYRCTENWLQIAVQYKYLIRRLTSQYGWAFLRVDSILASLYDCFLFTLINLTNSCQSYIHTFQGFPAGLSINLFTASLQFSVRPLIG